jgi:DNA (cytosine-5)-methyltransferase 1
MATILNTLSELGYYCEWLVCNSKDFGVPQSRRRVYIIGYLDKRCAGKILPVCGANSKALIQMLPRKGGSQGDRIYSTSGLAVTQLSRSGGLGGKTGLYFIDLNSDPKITQQARCIKARYDSGVTKRKGENSGVVSMLYPVGFSRKDGVSKRLDSALTVMASYYKGFNNQTQNAVIVEKAHAVITPERESIRQHGRRIKNAEEPMFTLTSQDKHGVLLIKEATKKGFKEATIGDSVDLAFSGQNTRRGRVGNSVAHTLDTGSSQGVVTIHGRIRRLMPRECLRLQGFDENQIDRILAVSSDSQAYKQAGNAVTVNVVHAIGLRLRQVHEGVTMT